MSSINVGSLELTRTETQTSICLMWSGEADERDPGKFLMPFLDESMKQAMSAAKEVVLDFTDLQFMNSSSIGLAISFVKTLHEKGVPATLTYNTNFDWQMLSLKCTRTIFSRYERVTLRDTAVRTSKF